MRTSKHRKAAFGSVRKLSSSFEKELTSQKILENPYFQCILLLTTACALFGDDVRILVSEPIEARESTDRSFLALSSFAFALFIFEIVLQCSSVDGYISWPRQEGKTRWEQLKNRDFPAGSFFFWLDAIATCSLVFDMAPLLDHWGGRDPLLSGPIVLNLGEVEDANYDATVGHTSDGVDGGAAQSARASRASLAGARASRVIRLVRMVRLIRIVKLCKSMEAYQDPAEEGDPRRSTLHNLGNQVRQTMTTTFRRRSNKVAPQRAAKQKAIGNALFSNSRVGKTMSELTQRRVIVGILSILLALPMLEYPTSNDTPLFAARLAHSFLYKSYLCNATKSALSSSSSSSFADDGDHDGAQSCTSYSRGLAVANNLVVDSSKKNAGASRLVAMKHTVQVPLPSPSAAFNTSAYVVYDPEDGFGSIGKTYNVRKSALVTTVVRSRLKGSQVVFKTVTHWDNTPRATKEAEMSLLLTSFVIALLGFGMFIITADTQRLVITPVENMMLRVSEISNDPLSDTSAVRVAAEQEGLETTFLLHTIDKIGNLMRIGFGEAGAAIIAENLKDSGDDQLDIDRILAGRGIVSIFGFCDIRNFTDTTECLGEEVMTFVNRIAHLLHFTVQKCGGAANKNIGDAFLLPWKVPPEKCDPSTGEIFEGGASSELFDSALFAFAKFTVLLRRHDNFVTNFSNEAGKRLFQRMPHYQCALGMGLHVGVAVEGAIGTREKIDATYISQHVNNSEFLEASTKTYGVPLLLSDAFFAQLSPTAQALCRRLDTVRVNPELTFELWAFDMDVGADFGQTQPLRPKTPARKKKMKPPTPSSNELSSASQLSVRSARLSMDLFEERMLETPQYTKKTLELLGDAPHGQPPPLRVFPDGQKKFSACLWHTDPDIQLLRRKMAHPGLMEKWAQCSELYHSGHWRACAAQLTEFQASFVSKNRCRDAPADFLLGLIRGSGPAGVVVDDPGHLKLRRVPRCP